MSADLGILIDRYLGWRINKNDVNQDTKVLKHGAYEALMRFGGDESISLASREEIVAKMPEIYRSTPKLPTVTDDAVTGFDARQAIGSMLTDIGAAAWVTPTVLDREARFFHSESLLAGQGIAAMDLFAKKMLKAEMVLKNKLDIAAVTALDANKNLVDPAVPWWTFGSGLATYDYQATTGNPDDFHKALAVAWGMVPAMFDKLNREAPVAAIGSMLMGAAMKSNDMFTAANYVDTSMFSLGAIQSFISGNISTSGYSTQYFVAPSNIEFHPILSVDAKDCYDQGTVKAGTFYSEICGRDIEIWLMMGIQDLSGTITNAKRVGGMTVILNAPTLQVIAGNSDTATKPSGILKTTVAYTAPV